MFGGFSSSWTISAAALFLRTRCELCNSLRATADNALYGSRDDS